LTAQDALALLSQKNITSNAYATAVTADGGGISSPTPGPNTYYRLGDKSAVPGAAMVDTNSALDGTYAGTCTPLQAGALIADVDACVAFGSASAFGTGYATAPPNSVGPSTGAFSIELWVNFPAGGQVPISLATNADGSGALAFLNITYPIGKPRFFLASSAGVTNIDITGANALDVNLWHQLVATRNSAGTGFNLYADGALVASGTSGSAINMAGAYRFVAADLSLGIPPVPGMSGLIDEIMITTSEFTPTQVATHYTLGLGAFASQQSGARIGAVLDVLSWPAGMRTIGTGASTLQAQTTSLATTKALTHMQDVEKTEAGAVYCSAAGKVVFTDRNTIVGTAWGAVVATFGDGAAEIHFEPGATPALDTVDLYTEATVQRNNGVTQFANDVPAGALYGERTRSITGTLSSTDTESLGRAQWEVDRYHAPLERLASITVDVGSQGPTVAAAIAACQLFSLVQINRTDITGASFAQTAVVEGITEDATDVNYHATLSLSPVQAQLYWILGTSALDTTTRLSF
jgi:hypothetical protein